MMVQIRMQIHSKHVSKNFAEISRGGNAGRFSDGCFALMKIDSHMLWQVPVNKDHHDLTSIDTSHSSAALLAVVHSEGLC